MSAELEFQCRVAALSNPQLDYMQHLITQGADLESALRLAEERVRYGHVAVISGKNDALVAPALREYFSNASHNARLLAIGEKGCREVVRLHGLGATPEAALHLAEQRSGRHDADRTAWVPVTRLVVSPRSPVQPSRTAASGGRRLSRSQRKALRARRLL